MLQQNVDLKSKPILITGAAGFIGANLSERLLRDIPDAQVIGLDSVNDYYDVRLKEYRLSELTTYPNFTFIKGSLADKALIDKTFEQYQPQIVVNLAAQAALDADSANPELQAARDNAAAALAAAQNTAAAAQSDYTAKSAARQAAEDALKTAKANSGYDALYQAYAAADQAWLQARSTYETATETLRQAKENMETAAENLENAGTSDEIEELEEQIADCTITAGASGTITTLNATVGSAAGGGTSNTALAVIQNTDDLKVSITIDEDDIKSVAVGQQAIIKSDATGDTEIAGTVSQLSLTSGSTGSTQGGTGSSGFGAEVTVTGKDSGLLIGLSAKVEIILSQVTDVYAVPYDAVGTDENGGSVVYARSGGETEFTAIPVETGMETDYYIEISGEGLSDGMEVKTSANDTATAAAGADDAQQSGENAMFSMDMGGGMPGGDMPGGGGMPSGGPGGM